MRRDSSAVVGCLLTLVMVGTSVGCGGVERVRRQGRDLGALVRPTNQTVFLRSSFDDDPSTYLGGMLKNGLKPSEIDETRGFRSRCAKYLKTKVVNSNMMFTQVFNAADSVKASLGVAQLGNISGGASSDEGLLVTYKLKRKMLVEFEDEDRFHQCCEAAPDQCTEKMVGEFMFGNGTISQFAGAAEGGSAGGSYGGVDADITIKNGAQWKRVVQFDSVYFAFRTRDVRGAQTAGGTCGKNWVNSIPSSLDGKYFVGISPGAATESQARELARRDARKQAIRFLGEELKMEYSEHSQAVAGVFDDESFVKAAAAGVARRVKDRCWADIEVQRMPEGPSYIARVLSFFPKADEQAAKVETLQEAAKAAGGKARQEIKVLERKVRGK